MHEVEGVIVCVKEYLIGKSHEDNEASLLNLDLATPVGACIG